MTGWTDESDNKHNFNTDTKGETFGPCDPPEVIQLVVSCALNAKSYNLIENLNLTMYRKHPSEELVRQRHEDVNSKVNT